MTLFWVVDNNDMPGNALPDDVSAEQFLELMEDFDRYWPGAVESLKTAGAQDPLG